MQLLKKVTAIYDRVVGSLAILGAALIVIAMLIVTLGVVMRYLLHNPLVWVLETTEYILVWFTFLGAAWILKKEGHVKVEILTDKLSPRVQALLGIITSIIGAILCSFLIIYGTQIVWDSFQRNILMTTMLKPPRAPLLAVIPIGSFLLFIQFLRRAYGYLECWQEPLSKEKQA